MLNNCEAKGLGCVLTLPIYRGREQHGNGREAGDKGTGSGRVRYGRREVLTPLSPPTFNFFTPKHYRSRCRSRWENLDRGQYPFQPIKFTNLVVPNPYETGAYNNSS